MRIQSPVTALLDEQQVAYRIIEIPLSEDKKPVRQLEELLHEQGLKPKSVVRSIVFRTGSDQFVLLALAGGGRADWASLREQLEERKLRMAEYEEVQAATGYVVGAVAPIALPADLKVLVDSSVFDYEDVVIGSGVLGYALGLKSRELAKLLADAPMGNFAQH